MNHTVGDCLRSVFVWHNETLSIWSHVFAAVFWAWQTVRAQRTLLAREKSLFPHRAAFLAYGATVTLSMVSSVVFHTFRPSGESTYARLSTFDFTCIALALTGTQFAQAVYQFPGRPRLQRAYAAALAVVGAAALAYTNMPAYTSPSFRLLRTMVFCSMGMFALVAAAHAAAIAPAGRRWATFRPVVPGYSMVTVATLAYLLRFPERYWPEAFDNTLQSHVLMHVLFFLGHWVWWACDVRRYEEQASPAAAGDDLGDPKRKPGKEKAKRS
jgi:adiponectin receptor